MTDAKTQRDMLLDLLRLRGERGVTALEALHEIGSFRLGARIYDLRREGFQIEAERVKVGRGSYVAKYVLVESPVQLAAFG